MGVFKMFSSSSGDKKLSCSMFGFSSSKQEGRVTVAGGKLHDRVQNNLPNPNPNNYKILRHREYEGNLMIEIQYLDCKNYEGKKILVFEKCTLRDLKKQKVIDPHFSSNKKFHSPIARFEPTKRGWMMAEGFLAELFIEWNDPTL